MTAAQRILRARAFTEPGARPLCAFRANEGDSPAMKAGSAFVPELGPPPGDTRAPFPAS